MKNLFRFLILMTLFFTTTKILNAQWVKTNGPSGKCVTDLAFSSTNIFAGTWGGGVYLSTNNGTNWTAVNSGLTNLLINKIVVQGSNVFAGTWGSGVYRSTNNGTSWNQVNNGLTGKNISTFAVIGTNLFAGTDNSGVFLSTNSGSSWSAINNGLTSPNNNIFAVSGTNLYDCVGGAGIFLSIDNGSNWTKVDFDLPDNFISALVFSGTNLFAATNRGVCLSTNGGANWTLVNSGLWDAGPIRTLVVSGTDILAGTDGGVYLSTNNGTNWNRIDNGLTCTYIAALAVLGNNLFAGTTVDGVFLSTDSGFNWTAANDGMQNVPSYSVRSIAVSGSDLLAGTMGGGVFLSTNNGISWTAVNEGLKNIYITAVMKSGTNFYAATQGVYRSTNNGTNWTKSAPYANTTSLAESDGNLFVGDGFGYVYRSTDNGATWAQFGTQLANNSGGVQSLFISGTNIFAGTAFSGVYISNINNPNWIQSNIGSGYTDVRAFTVMGNNLFAGTSGGVFLSTDNGTNWSQVNSGLSNTNINALAVSGNKLFACTNYGGVFLSNNNGMNWIEVNAGLPATSNNYTLAVTDTYLFLGIKGYGGSVWSRPLSEFTYILSTSSNPSSGGTTKGDGTFNQGANVTVMAFPNNGFTFVNWTENGTVVSTDTNYTFTITGDRILIANFSEIKNSVSTSSNPSSGGTTKGDGTFNQWTNVTVKAFPNNGFIFVNWTENGTVISTYANYTFTITGNRTLVANFSVETNGSALFDGTYSRIRTTDAIATNPNAYKINGTALSVEAWIYPMDYPNSQLGNTIVARTLNMNYTEPWTSYRLWINHLNGISLPSFTISDGTPGNTVTVQSSVDIPSFQWTHLAGTYDGTFLKIYVNGELKGEINTSISINSDYGIGFYIGRFLTDSFQGAIDEVRLWNSLRSPSDIQIFMNTELTGNEEGLAGYWKMNSISNNIMLDQTANHCDLPVQSGMPIIPFNPLTPIGVPTLSLSSGSIDFGSIEQGSVAKGPITITNSGTGPLLGTFHSNNSDIVITSGSMFYLEAGHSSDKGIYISPSIPGEISGLFQVLTNATSAEIPFTLKSFSYKQFDVNNISMWILRNGRFAINPFNNVSGLEWPKGSGKTAIYSSGIWIGANVEGSIRTAASFYRSEFAPGPIINSTAADPNDFTYRVYKIQNGDNEGNNPDFVSWPAALGAPVNSDGSPKIIGDQTLFSVYNDLNQANHYLGSPPLGAEVQQTVFGFTQPGPLENTVFLRFKIINKSPKTWYDTYISLWSDPDLGNPGDDLIGIDTTKNLGFVYNGSNTDQIYGTPTPAAGYKILKGAFFTKPIQAFSYFTNSNTLPWMDPRNSFEAYNFMKGLWSDGSPYIDPTTNLPTNFALAGDPVNNQGWVDSNPADRRFLFSTGPLNMEPGQSKEIIAAIILGQGSSNLNSITVLKGAADEIQNLFDSGQIFGGALENVVTVTVPEGTTNSLNDISNSGAQITVTSGSGGATIEAASYVAPPPGVQTITTPSIASVGKYLEVDVQGTVSWPIPICIYYTRNDLLQVGIVESDLQGIFYWQGLTNQWKLYSNSGSDDQGRGPSTTWVDTTNVNINGVNYEGFAAADAYHLTQMILAAKKKSITERYNFATQFIQSLPDDAFKKPADTRRKQLIKMLEQSKSKYDAGNMKSAAQYLEQSVLNHLMSNSKSGNDLWVTDESSRTTLLRTINELIDVLLRPQTLGKIVEGGLNVTNQNIEIPTEYGLSQNYPNPFNPVTRIRFGLPENAITKLIIYDVLGREIETLINSDFGAGYHEVEFNGSNLPSGIYIYRIKAGEFTSVKKMILMK